jgi:predicted RNase H-like nuclease
MRIIGVDCSTNEGGVAVAVGHLDDGRLLIEPPIVCGGATGSVLEVLVRNIGEERPCLFAFDAPLGWPSDLGSSLSKHNAGAPLEVDANMLFRRRTDRFIKRETGQQPLDVGADRIARTAYWALNLLGQLRRSLKADIPLAWNPTDTADLSAIEVYPAASLRVRGISTVGYKKTEQVAARAAIVDALASSVTLPEDRACLTVCADALDAAICVIAGADFVRGDCLPPDDSVAAKREGWIWVHDPKGLGAKPHLGLQPTAARAIMGRRGRSATSGRSCPHFESFGGRRSR